MNPDNKQPAHVAGSLFDWSYPSNEYFTFTKDDIDYMRRAFKLLPAPTPPAPASGSKGTVTITNHGDKPVTLQVKEWNMEPVKQDLTFDYAGLFVTVKRNQNADKSISTYDDGEYFVLASKTVNVAGQLKTYPAICLSVIRPTNGWDLSYVKSIVLTPDAGYFTVTRATEDWDRVEDLINKARTFSRTRGDGKWADYVYDNAHKNAETMCALWDKFVGKLPAQASDKFVGKLAGSDSVTNPCSTVPKSEKCSENPETSYAEQCRELVQDLKSMRDKAASIGFEPKCPENPKPDTVEVTVPPATKRLYCICRTCQANGNPVTYDMAESEAEDFVSVYPHLFTLRDPRVQGTTPESETTLVVSMDDDSGADVEAEAEELSYADQIVDLVVAHAPQTGDLESVYVTVEFTPEGPVVHTSYQTRSQSENT